MIFFISVEIHSFIEATNVYSSSDFETNASVLFLFGSMELVYSN